MSCWQVRVVVHVGFFGVREGGVEALTDHTAQKDAAEMCRNGFEPQAEA